MLGRNKYMGIGVLMDGYSRHVEEISGTVMVTRTMGGHGNTYQRRSVWIGVTC